MLINILIRTLLPFGVPLALVLAVFFLARNRVGFIKSLPTWLWVTLILAIIALWILVILWRWWSARRRAKAIEAGIMKQAQWGVENATPARRAEMEEIRKNLTEAMAMLRNGPEGKRSLYALPWYMIIGPPAIGKTTLIVNSGLNFPGLTTARRMRGAGGTRNCDWWFSTDAILLDTAGRYAQSADRTETETEWFGFLDLLRKHRSKGPINGLILGYSMEALCEADDARLVHDARELRQRIDEITDKLHWSFPVYVLFTKSDLVAGFAEFFGSLSPAERQQVWGTVYPVDPKGIGDAGERFRAEFQALVRRLKEHRIRRMGSLAQGEQWGRSFMFPEEFAALGGRLHLFIETLFEPNPFRKDPPVFRGAYFSSGKQMGRPFDLVIAKIQSMLGLGGRGPATEVQAEKEDAYFVRDLFAKVLKGDRELVRRTRGSGAKWARIQFAGSAGLFLLSVLSSAWIMTSCVRLSGKMEQTRAAVTGLPRGAGAEATPELLSALDEIRRSAREGWRAFPLVVANSVSDSAMAVYNTTARERILRPVEADLARALDNPGSLDADQVRRALRAELMLVDPREAGEVGEPADLTSVVAEYAFPGTAPGTPAWKQLEGITEEFLRAKVPIRPLDDRRDELQSGGRRLAATHEAEESFRGLVGAASRCAKDLDLATLAGGGGKSFAASGDPVVRAAFTREGWEKCVSGGLKNFGRMMEADTKLLERIGVRSAGRPPTPDDLFVLYAQAYPLEWSDFLESVRLAPAVDCKELAPVLKELRRRNGSPLFQLLEQAAGAARLNPGAIEGVVGDGKLTTINEALDPLLKLTEGSKDKPSPADEYADLLADVSREVSGCADDPAYAANKAALDDAQDWVDGYVDRFPGRAVAPALGDLLAAPVSAARQGLKVGGGQAAEGAFADQVAGPMEARLGDRYPFGRSDEMAGFDDVVKFLGPDGEMETFAAQLRKDRKPLSPEFEDFLRDLAGVRSALRMSGSELKTGFTLTRGEIRALDDTGTANLARIDQVVVTINGERLVFQAEGESWPVEWSSDAASTVCALDLRYTRDNKSLGKEEFDSPWAICELLDKAQSSRGGSKLVWKFPDSGVEVEFQLAMRGGAECPFARGSAFRRLPANPPRRILASGE